MSVLRVGVLAIQGAFAEHAYSLDQARLQLPYGSSVQVMEVRTPSDLDHLHGLILPGGESTTLSFFLEKEGFLEKLTAWIHRKSVIIFHTIIGTYFILFLSPAPQGKGGFSHAGIRHAFIVQPKFKMAATGQLHNCILCVLN